MDCLWCSDRNKEIQVEHFNLLIKKATTAVPHNNAINFSLKNQKDGAV